MATIDKCDKRRFEYDNINDFKKEFLNLTNKIPFIAQRLKEFDKETYIIIKGRESKILELCLQCTGCCKVNEPLVIDRRNGTIADVDTMYIAKSDDTPQDQFDKFEAFLLGNTLIIFGN